MNFLCVWILIFRSDGTAYSIKIMVSHNPTENASVALNVPLAFSFKGQKDQRLLKDRSARKNTRCYGVETIKTAMLRNCHFSRTVVDWNNLEDSTVCAEAVEAFRSLLSS